MSFQNVVTNKPGIGESGTAVVDSQALVDYPVSVSPGHRKKATASTEALRVLDLSKNFRSGFLRKTIRGIDGVSFSVAKGEVFALLGHNGAGKTTTINCILDLVHRDGGEVAIFNRPGSEIQSRAKVGYLPERPYFFEHLTGRELLEFYAKLLGVPSQDRKIQIDDLLEKMGMTSAAQRPLRKYSKGMLQRIGLAQALLGDPELLILDEPMSGLDPMGRREVRHLLQDLKSEGKTIIMSSHIVPDVEVLADRVGIMCGGQLVETCHMSQLAHQNSYEVRVQDSTSSTGQTIIRAADAEGLGQCLEDCRKSGRTVLSVDTKRTGLEDLFMQVHNKWEES